jgi:hypothetical protein
MPHYLDLFPQNYGVSANPLDTLNVNPLQFLGGSPFGNPLQMAEDVLNGFITLANLVIQAVLPGLPQIPSLTTLLTDLSTFLGPLNFLSGIPIIGQLFGTGGSNTGLFGSSSLFSAGGLFGGLLSNIPFLGQLIGAGGGNPNAPNLINEFVNIFTGSGGLGFGSLISLFTNAVPGLSGASGLGSIFTDMLGLLGNPTSLGSGSPALPGVSSIPLLGGLFGSTGMLGGFLSNVPILGQLINLIPGIGGGLTGLGGLGSIFTDLFGLLGHPTGVGSGSPALPGVSSIPLLGGLFGSSGLLGGFLGNVPILGQLINLVPGIGSGLTGLGGLGSIFTDLFGLLGNPTAVGTGSPVLGSLTSIPLLGGLFGSSGMLSGFLSNVPILGQLISGFGGSGSGIADLILGIGNQPKSITNIFGAIPVGQLSTTQPNLLKSPIFTSDAVGPNPDWSVDTTTTRTADGSGSLKVTANGIPKALRSGQTPGDTIKVGVGQNLTLTIYGISQAAVSGTGGPAVLLQIQPFASDGTPLPLVTVANWTPSADTAWPGRQLTGTYAVPQGVTAVQARLYLTSQALEGVYHFDDGSLTQVADMGVIPGLTGTLNTIDNSRRALMDTLVTALRGFPVVGTELADIATAVSNFNPLNMLGSLGSTSASGDLFGIVGHLIDALMGHPAGTTTSGSLAQLYTAMTAAIHNTAGSDVTQFADTTTVIPITSWANQIDVIGVGKGQDGEAGTVFNFDGQGGQGGQVNMVTWLRGTHYDSGTGNVTVTINSGGSVTISIPAGTATAAHSLTCAVGSGTQSPHFGAGYTGIGNAAVTYNGKPYAFGGNQNTPGAPGLAPGGGGAGGGGLATFFQPGGPGAPGGGWVRQLATAAGTSTGADTTAPSVGTGHFVSATNTSITVSASGAVDA